MRNLCASYAHMTLLGPADPPAFLGPVRPKYKFNTHRCLKVLQLFVKNLKIYIKPKDLNENVLQNQSLRATQKEMKSIQKVSTNDLRIK